MNRLATLQRGLLYSALATLLLTGAYWALIHYLGVRAWLGEPLLMKIHGAAAMLALVLLGGLLPAHVAVGWSLRRNRPSGAVLLAVCGLLTLTGYLLYYAGDELARDASSYVHLALGVVLPLVLGAHLTGQSETATPWRQPESHACARARSSR